MLYAGLSIRRRKTLPELARIRLNGALGFEVRAFPKKKCLDSNSK